MLNLITCSSYTYEEVKNYPKNCKYIRNDLIEKRIKNCRGVKKSNDGINKENKEKQRHNF